jgi:hypothetical protein
MDTVTNRRTVEDYTAELRELVGGDDSIEHFNHVEACALDRVESAIERFGTTDANRIAEARDVMAALRLVRRERSARLKAARTAELAEARA